MENYSAAQNNEIMQFAATWSDLEMITLSEVSQRKTNICYHLYVESKKNDTSEFIPVEALSPKHRTAVLKSLLNFES